MKTFLACSVATLAVSLIGAGRSADSPADLRVGHIEAESIVLRHPDGHHDMKLVATPQGCGIWITDHREEKKGQVVAIYNLDGQGACVGVDRPGQKGSITGHKAALSLNEQGGFLQLIEGKVIRHLTAAKLDQ